MTTAEARTALLDDVGALVAREIDLDRLLDRFAERVAQALDAERATLWLLDRERGELRSKVAILPEVEALHVPLGHGLVGHIAAHGTALRLDDVHADPRWDPSADLRTGFRTTSLLGVPVVNRRGVEHIVGVLQVLSKRGGSFTAGDQAFAEQLADQIATALDYTSLRADGDARGVRMHGRYNHVIGQSAAMGAVYGLLERAAATDVTVLLRGETGTGKGVVARAIHVNSARASAPFVHVDCTTLPAGLVESELFGHERGAYTGADQRVVGKVELADGGTLFLDELGELPLALQAKLLRFVQAREFERVGGREVRTADVRLIAATNRDLAELVARGEFRADLYYRLRVLEIVVPPLRARGPRDVAILAEHFVDAMARRHRRPPMRLSDAARARLAAYTWPGNVRELEHAIERAVVLSADDIIHPDELALTVSESTVVASSAPIPPASGVTLPAGLRLAEAERAYAAFVVERCAGNQSEAARQLGIGRATLARLLRTPKP